MCLFIYRVTYMFICKQGHLHVYSYTGSLTCLFVNRVTYMFIRIQGHLHVYL